MMGTEKKHNGKAKSP